MTKEEKPKTKSVVILADCMIGGSVAKAGRLMTVPRADARILISMKKAREAAPEDKDVDVVAAAKKARAAAAKAPAPASDA